MQNNDRREWFNLGPEVFRAGVSANWLALLRRQRSKVERQSTFRISKKKAKRQTNNLIRYEHRKVSFLI